jgi:hypothetical protein
MGKVYKNSIMCIAAAASENAEGGLFRARDPAYVASHRLEISSQTCKRSYDAVHTYLWTSGVVEAPLNRRGWAVQERLFAPRTVYFGMNQIFWECQHLQACEALPDSIPSDLISDEICSLKTWHTDIATALATNRNESNIRIGGIEAQRKMLFIYRPWKLVVETFTRCNLTVLGDKLVALSATAKEMQTILNDTYVAGLWKHNLVSQLLWSASNKTPALCRSQSYRAPTWSWASVDGPVKFPFVGWKNGDFIEVLEIQVTPVSSSNIHGQVIAGHLRIRGQLVQLPVLDSNAFHSLEDRTGCCHPDDRKENFKSCYGLPVLSTVALDLWGLVLVPTGAREHEYRRVGVFQIFGDERLEYLGRDLPEGEDYDDNDEYFDQTIPKSIVTIV